MTVNITVQSILALMKTAGKLDQMKLSRTERYVIQHIIDCHSKAMGLTYEVCPDCGHTILHYGSCNDRNCPMCGVLKRKKWELQRQDDLLDAQYYHIIFTVPNVLNPLFNIDRAAMCSIMLKAQRAAIEKLAKDKKYLGAVKTGMISIVHTWGQKLQLHPHVHSLLVAGGLDKDGNWITPKREDYLFPAKLLAKEFRDVFVKLLEKSDSELISNGYHGLAALIEEVRKLKWNVEICEATSDPEHIIEYFARYANRPAISNSRLVSYEDGKVTYKYKDNKQGGKECLETIQDTEFVRRFLVHILPSGFQKIRNYGFLSNKSRKDMVPKIRELIGTKPQQKRDWRKKLVAFLEEFNKRKLRECPVCHHRMLMGRTITDTYSETLYQR